MHRGRTARRNFDWYPNVGSVISSTPSPLFLKWSYLGMNARPRASPARPEGAVEKMSYALTVVGPLFASSSPRRA